LTAAAACGLHKAVQPFARSTRWGVLLFLPALFAGAQVLPTAAPPAAAQRLAPGDLIQIRVLEAPELATETRLDAHGVIAMPEAGSVPLAGQTAAQAARSLAARLRATYLLHPQVQVRILGFASEPVAVLGAVARPGVYSARRYADLAAVLAAAGWSAPAAGRILVTRAAGGATRTVDGEALARGRADAALPLRAGDVVRVVPAAQVYVAGDVARPGAFPLPASGLTLLQALALAGGIARFADARSARIVRRTPGAPPRALRVDARAVLRGRAPDPRLEAFDLIYIPHSALKATAVRALETAVTTISGVIIFR
jgi:polysaccharide export outer membrane protein